jgi:hypothetical protein
MRVMIVAVVASLVFAGCAGQEAAEPEPDATSFEEFDLDSTDVQLGVMRGVVVDGSISPLAGAIVSLLNQDLQMTTNADGAFAFKDLEPGAYFLQVNKTGYGSIQSSTEVIAGAKDPAVVRILMERVPGTVPMIIPDKYAGYITCSLRIPAAGFNDGCGVFGDIGLGSTQRRNYAFEKGNVEWIQTDLSWEPSSETAKEMCVIIGGASASTPACGPNNLVRYIDTNAVEADGLHKGEAFSHVTYPNHYAGDISGNIVLQQSFEVFVHAFYNFIPAEGWSFVVDGEHVIPS